MQKYFIKTPWIVKKMFPNYIWNMPANNNAVYLTFDDGPHPRITSWVLDELKKYNAKASFFCIGKNVVKHPDIYYRIISEGHTVGNHTYNHLNGWKVSDEKYIHDINEAARYISTNLFRPPYGRIRANQFHRLNKAMQKESKIIMWDVLSADFNAAISPEQCLKNVISNTVPGSIIVFHDSEKAYTNLVHTLPAVMQLLNEKKCLLKKIEFN
ncbi:MAG: polysaccharide deacetylase family protein [Bacteroidota bacterium]|nr:polysaccharide deacetylase family protein [Bacteroidota bacterium]